MGSDLKYSDGIAAARTMIALEGSAATLQQRLPSGWEVAPGTTCAEPRCETQNMLVPFHEVYAVRTYDERLVGLPQVSYIAFVSRVAVLAGCVSWQPSILQKPLAKSWTALAYLPGLHQSLAR
jgi:hypothetical protein